MFVTVDNYSPKSIMPNRVTFNEALPVNSINGLVRINDFQQFELSTNKPIDSIPNGKIALL